MFFSKESPTVQQEHWKFINRRWAQLHELEKEWSNQAIKFLMFTNSGGALAVLGFMGASEAARNSRWAQIALGCFAFGVVFVGILTAFVLHHMGHLFFCWRRDAKQYLDDKLEWGILTSNDEKRSGTRKPQFILGYVSFGLFFGGCVAAAVSLFSNS